MKKVIVGILIASVLLHPLGLLSVAFAETAGMEYTDPEHIHAPKVVDGVTYEYDANGNLINDGERVISWNQDNLPVRVKKGGQIVEFFYDANGRRIVKRSGEDKTVYVNQYYEQLTINNEQSAIKHYFANGRAAQSVNDALTFLHNDHLGSTVLSTNTNSQPLSDSLFYFPYGSSISNQQLTISNYLFTGQELDPESDLYNYNARLYDPTTGAFISADILEPERDSSRGLNRYGYVEGNPMKFTDPTGLRIPEETLAEMRQRIEQWRAAREGLAQGEELSFMDFTLFMKEWFGDVGVTAELWESVRPEVEELFGANVAEAITRSVANSENLQCVGFARACLRAMGSNLPPLGLETGALGRPLEGLVWRGPEDIQQIEAGDVFVYQRRVGDEVREHLAIVSGKTGESVTLVEAVGSPFRYGNVYAPAGGIMLNERTVDLSTGHIFGMETEIIVGYGFYRPEK